MSTPVQLPYNPTKLFRSSSHLYIFDTSTGSDQRPRLQALNLRDSFDTSSITPTILSDPLQLWSSTDTRPFATLLHPDGNVTAVSSSCGDEKEGTQAWRFQPDSSSTSGNGSWSQLPLKQTGDAYVSGYLADGMVFAPEINSTSPDILLFGGMCPTSDSTAQTWTTDASYSNDMVQIVQPSDVREYTIDRLPTQGGPIAAAGFSITSLAPLVTAGSGSVAQALQQNFVLIGGHTKSAFINMSQVAIFSMPHQTWTFQPVQQLQDSRADLTQSTSSQVEPRSGHTAVLTEDGSKIIVLGGWVGDVNSPAQPQLAVLEVGSGYGGNMAWKWTTPSLAGTGLPSNTGIYGHGAAMLPGGIMLVHGGYSVSTSSSRIRRAESNTRSLLFNTTSNTWISTYSPPATSSTTATVQASAASSDALGQKIGLAVGLTVGMLILIGLLVFYFWHSRRLKRKALERSRGLESRSSDGSVAVISQPFLEKHSIDGRGGDMAAPNNYWLNAGQPSVPPMEQNSAATGLFVDIPSPTRGLRKGLASRNYQYHVAPRYDEKRLSRGSGNIHPIAELDDEDANSRCEDELMSEAQRQLKEVERILQGNRKASTTVPDPLRSHPVSPELASGSKSKEHTSPSTTCGAAPRWPSDAYSYAEPSGRLSPTKSDERTSSTLSEASQRSVLSNSSITRTMSTRTGRVLAAAAAAHVRAKAIEVEASSSSDARTSTMSTDGGRRTPHELARSSTTTSSVVSRARSAAADSFRTARSTPAHEGDALLGLPPTTNFEDPYRRALAADHQQQPFHAPTRRHPGILGSLRRAIGAIAPMDRTLSLASSRGGAEIDGPSASSSPIKERRAFTDGLPRRTVSDGGALLRQKRGKHDWADGQWPPYSDDPDPGDWGQPYRSSIEKRQAEEDWDVEGAVTKRDVQVMFTVPKSRLRVVNADADRASLRSVSDGALSRAGSVRVLATKESRAMLGVRDEDGRKV